MNKTIIAYGICADNNDPWGVGRIRVIVDDNSFQSRHLNYNIKSYLEQVDAQNQVKNGTHAYIPWELGDRGREPDPYVIEPFLPKHFNLVPKIGESVKIVFYDIDNPAGQREYVAPQISNYDKLIFDSVETARSYTRRSAYYAQRNNLRLNGLIPDITDVALMGRSNSDIILPENEFFARAGHQNFVSKTKNQRIALLQGSYFKQRKTIVTETKNEDQSPSVRISRIFEFFTETVTPTADDPLYIITNIFIYPVENVTTKNYSATKEYIQPDMELADHTQAYLQALADNSEMMITVKTNNANNTISFIKELLANLDKNKMMLDTQGGDWVNKPQNNPNLVYLIYDNRSSEDTDPTSYSLQKYQVRSSKENDYFIAEVRDIALSIANELHPNKYIPSVIVPIETETFVDDPSYEESVFIGGADKVFLLSWFNSQSPQNKIGKYGFSQDEIYRTLQKNTEAMVKGDTLLNLLSDMLDLFANHGHSTGVDPIGSLNKDAVAKIQAIRETYKLTTPVTPDLTGGSTILNQYIRLD